MTASSICEPLPPARHMQVSMSPVNRVRSYLIVLAALALLNSVSAQVSRKILGWPPQVVLVRDEITPVGSLGHLLVNGKEVAKTLEPNGETAQITVSRAHLHHMSTGSTDQYSVLLDDLDDGDSGEKLRFRLGNFDDKSAGYVVLGTAYASKTVTADLSGEAGQKLLKEIEHEKDAGKEIVYEVQGNTLCLTVQEPVNGEEALGLFRRTLYGTSDPDAKDLMVNFDFRATDEYKAEALGISESIVRQLTVDERRFEIKQLEIPWGTDASKTDASDTTGHSGNTSETNVTSKSGTDGSNSTTVPDAGATSVAGVKTRTTSRAEDKAATGTKVIPHKPGDEQNSVEQGFKRSAEPDQPTTFDNRPTPPVQQTDKKKDQPPPQ